MGGVDEKRREVGEDGMGNMKSNEKRRHENTKENM